jgi:menaquinone-dependent protoporphyrinogen oxidase
MKAVLVAYATTDGQTRKVASFVAEALQKQGLKVDLVDTATPSADAVQPRYAAAVLAGSLHEHLHQRALQNFVQRNVGWLNAIPVLFLSVSLEAAMPDAVDRHQAQQHLQGFLVATGLQPLRAEPVAGALRYTQYDWLRRTMVKLIARQMGASTDTEHDCEYTDWDALERTVDGFVEAAKLAPAEA